MDWHILILGKSYPEAHRAKEGDIIDVMPINTQHGEIHKKTLLIIPVSGLTRVQAMALKEPGLFMKRKYKISLSDATKIDSISESDIRDNEKEYQPFLDKNIITDISKANIVTDKSNEIVNMSSIELRL